MGKRKLYIGLLIAGVILAGSIMLSKTTNPVSDTVGVKDTLISGQTLFRLNCAGCHGMDLRGNPPTFPPLSGIEDKLNESQVREQIKNGKGNMPSMAHLSDEEIDGIIGYLYNKKVPDVNMAALIPVEEGEMLFKSNCAGCHRATPEDPKPKNAGTQMCAMMTPATLGGIDQRYSYDQFVNVLDAGPCYMPSFSFLEDNNRKALYGYLKSLDVRWQGGPEHPGGMEHPRRSK